MRAISQTIVTKIHFVVPVSAYASFYFDEKSKASLLTFVIIWKLKKCHFGKLIVILGIYLVNVLIDFGKC